MKSYVDDVITIEDLRFWLLLGGTVAAYSLIRFAPRLIDLRGRFISPGELKEGLDRNEHLLLLDVRSPQEFSGPDGHIAGARLLPLEQLDRRAAARLVPPGERGGLTVVTLCNTGVRAAIATRRLRRAGLRAATLRGGLDAWRADLLPTTGGPAGNA